MTYLEKEQVELEAREQNYKITNKKIALLWLQAQRVFIKTLQHEYSKESR